MAATAQDPGTFLRALNDGSLYRNILPPPAASGGSLTFYCVDCKKVRNLLQNPCLLIRFFFATANFSTTYHCFLFGHHAVDIYHRNLVLFITVDWVGIVASLYPD